MVCTSIVQPWPLRSPLVLLVLLFAGISSTSAANSDSKNLFCKVTGLCENDDEATCGLYMAASSIPGAGWGMYTARDIEALTKIDYNDVIIQYPDHKRQKELQQELYNITNLPDILLTEYFWASSNTYSSFDADSIESISPGFGMLANCQLGLLNLNQGGCRERGAGAPRNHSGAGASSSYQDCVFTSIDKIPAGHELFDDYGDTWFETREAVFGDDLPLSEDYTKVDDIVRSWQKAVVGKDPQLAKDLWETVTKGVGPHLSKRSRRALPESAELASKINYDKARNRKPGTSTVAYQEYPDVIRTTEWLEHNGMCLDHIKVEPALTQERGAFARRAIPEGEMVAPAPLVHLSRKHTDILYADTEGKPTKILWKGHQLLLNYCFGHPSSSVLLFPYSPGVNLINHYNKEKGEIPNVAVRWSERMTKEDWLLLTADELMENNQHTGLMMEYYALTDIEKGDEILLDYGDAWQEAWDVHEASWNLDQDEVGTKVVNSDNYVSAYTFERQCNQDIAQYDSYSGMLTPPSWIELRCWLEDPSSLKHDEMGDTKVWSPPGGRQGSYLGTIDDTFPCTVIEVNRGDKRGKATFRVHVQHEGSGDLNNGVFITGVPRKAVTFVDRPYTKNEHLRSSFRHEIVLPDHMIPSSWKDLEPEPESKCGLYMAESAIPHSGLGMFSAKAIPKGERIFYGDVVVQAEDVVANAKFRHWKNRNYRYNEPDWLLYNYYWNADVTIGIYDADDVQSIIPGLGMLANSHTGLVNADIKAPTRSTYLHRGRDPGAGASTTYHDVHFDALVDVEEGAELFVMYGDDWFADRASLGEIPLSDDFALADESVQLLTKIFSGNTNTKERSDIIEDALHLLINITSTRPRLANAIPRDNESFEKALRKGAASLTVPNRVRSPEWLEKNGRCLDNIKPERSTIKQAGQGAFTTRRIKKGEVVAPMPLVHLRRHHMEIFDTSNYKSPNTDVWRDGTQLLLNYCYGHPESSLLLFPYSPVINYVNHNASNANVELRWSSLPNHHKQWLKRSPSDLDAEDHSGLIMEMVATRDIKADEEVFVNYGSDWDAAWSAFEDKWSPDEHMKRHSSSEKLNEQMEWLLTLEERQQEDYPFSNAESLMTVCFVGQLTGENADIGDDDKGPTYAWMGGDYLFDNANNLYPCDIIERQSVLAGEDGSYNRKDSIKPATDLKYMVVLENYADGENARVKDVPRKAIQFFDTSYTSDNFFRLSFRHEMYLPDNMVPEAWRDLK